MSFSLYHITSFFIIYAFFGWCLEVIYQAVEQGKFINRGFLNGPYCPIYGFGVIIVSGCLSPIKENILVLYIGSVVLTSALEFITGFILEKIFHQKWWDYSDEKLNIKGYICLKFSLLWGVACLVVVRIIHPTIEHFVDWIPPTLGKILVCIVLVGFISDMIVTIFGIMHIKKRLIMLEKISSDMRKISDFSGEKLFKTVSDIREKNVKLSEKRAVNKAKMDELSAKYKAVLSSKKITLSRIQKAFPKLNITAPDSEKDMRKKENNKK